MMGFRLFYNREENCQLLFPVPTSDIFKQDCGSDLKGLRVVSLGRRCWLKFNNKKNPLICILLLTFVFYLGMFSVSSFAFEVNISFLLGDFNDYLVFSFGIYYLFIFLYINVSDNNYIFEWNLPRITIKIIRPILSIEVE